jgi:serine/threonine-protein kinase RsbW
MVIYPESFALPGRSAMSVQEESGRSGNETVSRAAPWHGTTIRSLENIDGVTATIDRALAEAGYDHRDRFGVRLAVEEALANAIKHGHGGDEEKAVRVRYRVSPREVLVQVEDEGPGFDPGRVADPLSPENVERPSGRGLLLMRTYATWVRHHGRGNRVTLCRTRTVA